MGTQSSPQTDSQSDSHTNSMIANMASIRERIEAAARRCGRRAEDITLIGVTKTVPPEKIREAYNAGVRHFGENRVQEWESKREALADLDLTWHLIGHLQSNKVSRVAERVYSVDSLDSIALAQRLDRACGERQRRVRVLIEVKIDSSEAKTGVTESELPALVDTVLASPHLELRGLMGVPPYLDNAEKLRPYFRSLRELRDQLRTHAGVAGSGDRLSVLSMGMSHDFEVAIEEGASEIRLGSALFGVRDSN
jgi:PLP dependent protein